MIINTMCEYLTTCLCFPLMIASMAITREIVEVTQCNCSHELIHVRCANWILAKVHTLQMHCLQDLQVLSLEQAR